MKLRFWHDEEPKVWWVPPRWLLPIITKHHARIYRATGGRIGSKGRDVPHLIITTVGARSGQARTIPLPYFEADGDIYVVASNNGAPKNPSWWHNLRTNPDVVAQIRSDAFGVHAVSLEATERDALWPTAVSNFGWLAQYQAQIDRSIPLVRLDRIGTDYQR